MKLDEATRLRVAENITELVGETPLLHLRKVVPAGAADVFAKLEYLNPGGSVKDRAAVGMIRRAERDGVLRPGATITEATAGNTGIGLALIGVSQGYHVCVFVPERFAAEKIMLMRALGAEVIRTPDAEGMEGAIRRAKEHARKTNGFFAAQFENPANPDYHYQTTGREIYEQMQGQIDAVVIGAATAGTFSGVARFVKERLPHALAIVVEPQGSVFGGGKPGEHKVEGIGLGWIPKTFDTSLADEILMVHDDQSFAMVRELARREGVLAGGSGGANVYGAIQIANRLGPGKRVVTVIPDSAERYLSKGILETP